MQQVVNCQPFCSFIDRSAVLHNLNLTLLAVAWQEEAARKRRKLSSAIAAASTVDGRRLWGPPPPPQHSAMLRGKLATAVLSGAVGKTIVAGVLDMHACVTTNDQMIF